MIKFVLQYSESGYFQIATVLVCAGMPASYLMVALSNPGIVTQEDLSETEEEQENMGRRVCKICNIRVKRGTHHCSECDVCVRDYDHHCPWTSKCIGGGNIIRFYVFLGCVPLYLVYVFVAFAMLMSTLAIDNRTMHLVVQLLVL
jgi:hypothetical protein